MIVGVGEPLKVTFEVSVEPTYGLPVGCPGFANVGALEATGVEAADVAEATESPFMLDALTVNVYAVPFVNPEIVSGELEPEIVDPLLAVNI